MKKSVFGAISFVLCSTVLIAACASTNLKQEGHKNTEPEWITDKGRLELFPASSYISQAGYGSTPQESKEKAAASISEYIKTSILSTVYSQYFYKESANGVIENKELREDIKVSTDNTLYKLEYTNPYYYTELGQYVCVAFINKEQAFNYVKPKLEIARKQFPSAYYAALEKESVLDSIIGIKNAQKILPEFYEVFDFARVILPEQAKVYETVDSLAKESIAKKDEISRSVLIKTEGMGDIDLLEKSGVVSELSNQFKNIGFIISNSLKSNCIALVEVKSKITETKTTFETYPEIYIRVIEKGAEKISYAKKLSKVAGFDKDTVIRRTNIVLTEDIRTSFIKECF